MCAMNDNNSNYSPSKPPPSPTSERRMYPDLVGGESDGYLVVGQPHQTRDTLESLLPEVTLQVEKLQQKLLGGMLIN